MRHITILKRIIKKKYTILCFLSIIVLCNINSFAKPYGLRKTNKIAQFNGTIEFNYLFIDHESFMQFVFIPELTFGTIDLGLAIYAPLSFNNDYIIRTIPYNSVYGLLGLIYYIQYGTPKKNPFSFKVSEIKNVTLGQGLILNRYYNNLYYPEIRKLGLNVNFNKWGIIFNGIMGDIINLSVVGGRIALNTGKMLNTKIPILESLEIGFTTIADINPNINNIIKVYNRVEHKIIKKIYPNNNPVYIIGADLSFDFFKNDTISLALFSEFASINLNAEGFGYGISTWILPNKNFFNLNYKIQVNHSFNYFTPYYFNSLYDFNKINKINRIYKNKKNKTGIYTEIGLYFFNKKINAKVSYDDNFNDNYKPHIVFELNVINIPERLFITILYDSYNTDTKNTGNMTNLNDQLMIEFLYGFTSFAEFGFSFQKNFFVKEKNTTTATDTLLTISVFSKILF